MRSISTLIVAALFLNACARPQVTIRRNLNPNQRIRVAVLPFKDAPNAPHSGEMAAEEMMTYLLNVGSYDMIERSALDQIMQEQKLNVQGAIEPQTAAELGKLLGADALVVGAVSQYQNRRILIFPPAKVTVIARMVRTETGTVDWAGTYTLGWHPIKWAASFFWPLGVILAVTSPSAEDRLQKAAKGIAKKVAAAEKNNIASAR